MQRSPRRVLGLVASFTLVAGCASAQPSPRFAVSIEPLPSIAVTSGPSPSVQVDDPAIELGRAAERSVSRSGEIVRELTAILDGPAPLTDEDVRQRVSRLAQDAFRGVDASRRGLERTASEPCTEAVRQAYGAYLDAVERLGGMAVGVGFEPDNDAHVTGARSAIAEVDQLEPDLEAAIDSIDCG